MEKYDPSTQAIISDPSFRIFTTLRYTVFNEHDIQDQAPFITAWRTADDKVLALHVKRLQASATAFSWVDISTLLEREGTSLLTNQLDEALRTLPGGAGITAKGHIRTLRAHIDVSRTGHVDVSLTPMGEIQPLSVLETDSFHRIPSNEPLDPSPSTSGYCKVTVDTQPTPASLFTSHKTNHRTHYDEARSRAGITRSLPTEREVMLYNTSNEINEASLSTVYLYREGRWVTPAAECGGNLSVTRRLALENGFCVEGKVRLDDLRDGESLWLSNAARGFFRGRVVVA